MTDIIYMVAGMSSRFGGKIKQFAQVGVNGETLIEVSIQQAINAGFDRIIFVVGEKTEQPFKEKFGNSYRANEKTIPIFYAKQTFNPSERDKPWGTTDALISAISYVKDNFVVCNGDDIYGKNALKIAHDYLKEANSGATIGYKLKNVIPEEGKVNRGLFETDEEKNVTNIEEIFDISKENFLEKNLTEESLCSMTLFGLPKSILFELEKKLIAFKEKNKEDRKAECLLPVELGALVKEGKLKIKLLETNDKWFGVTNPDDEEKVRKQLASA
jgi:NDP-sugar pyrophosphorylase family protein